MRLISRTAAIALSVVVTLSAAAVPCMARDATVSKSGATLTRLSPASRSLLATARPAAAQAQPPASTPSSPSSFYKSTRGKACEQALDQFSSAGWWFTSCLLADSLGNGAIVCQSHTAAISIYSLEELKAEEGCTAKSSY